jgi:hypothetical protein
MRPTPANDGQNTLTTINQKVATIKAFWSILVQFKKGAGSVFWKISYDNFMIFLWVAL